MSGVPNMGIGGSALRCVTINSSCENRLLVTSRQSLLPEKAAKAHTRCLRGSEYGGYAIRYTYSLSA